MSPIFTNAHEALRHAQVAERDCPVDRGLGILCRIAESKNNPYLVNESWKSICLLADMATHAVDHIPAELIEAWEKMKEHLANRANEKGMGALNRFHNRLDRCLDRSQM